MMLIKNVFKRFGGVKALQGCSLEIEKGKITALIGPNGSGKSTLFNAISALITKDRGKIELEGEDISRMVGYKIAKKGISRTFQEVRLFKHLTIRDHLQIAISDDESLIKSFLVFDGISDKRIQEVLDRVHLDKPLGTFVTDLSYGQRKLLDLAIAIAKPHTLLMLDEPVAGVNPRLRKVIKEVLVRLSKEGETLLIIEHDMNFVMDLADVVYVLDEGRVIAHGKPKTIQKNKKVLDAYLGE
tara:strand:+ start:1028 stop:1753 length:726 start_codon:yes stop_codon:yes gene_type:complete